MMYPHLQSAMKLWDVGIGAPPLKEKFIEDACPKCEGEKGRDEYYNCL